MTLPEPLPRQCPECESLCTGNTCLTAEGKQPRPGDVSVCVACGTILVYDDVLALRRAVAIDLAPLEASSRALVEFLSREIVRRRLRPKNRQRRKREIQ